ncbi:hypothetical protein ACOMHN_013949 [Nucella lapillus]
MYSPSAHDTSDSAMTTAVSSVTVTNNRQSSLRPHGTDLQHGEGEKEGRRRDCDVIGSLSWARQTGRTFPSTPTVSSYSCSRRPEPTPNHTATIGHPSS